MTDEPIHLRRYPEFPELRIGEPLQATCNIQTSSRFALQHGTEALAKITPEGEIVILADDEALAAAASNPHQSEIAVVAILLQEIKKLRHGQGPS